MQQRAWQLRLQRLIIFVKSQLGRAVAAKKMDWATEGYPLSIQEQKPLRYQRHFKNRQLYVLCPLSSIIKILSCISKPGG